MRFISKSRQETLEIAANFARTLKVNDTVCLYGELGSGKTAFVQGILGFLCSSEEASSPTFTIVNEYDTEPAIYHFDVYRVHDPEELYAIGFEEYFQKEGIVIIEWANLIEEILPHKRIDVIIARGESDDEERVIEIKLPE